MNDVGIQRDAAVEFEVIMMIMEGGTTAAMIWLLGEWNRFADVPVDD